MKCTIGLSRLPPPVRYASINFRSQTPGHASAPGPFFDVQHPAVKAPRKSLPSANTEYFNLRAIPFALLTKPPIERQEPFRLHTRSWMERMKELKESENFEKNLVLCPSNLNNKSSKRLPMSINFVISKKATGRDATVRNAIVQKIKTTISLIVIRGATAVPDAKGRLTLVLNDEEVKQRAEKWILPEWTYVCAPRLELFTMKYPELVKLLRPCLESIWRTGEELEQRWVNQHFQIHEPRAVHSPGSNRMSNTDKFRPAQNRPRSSWSDQQYRKAPSSDGQQRTPFGRARRNDSNAPSQRSFSTYSVCSTWWLKEAPLHRPTVSEETLDTGTGFGLKRQRSSPKESQTFKNEGEVESTSDREPRWLKEVTENPIHHRPKKNFEYEERQPWETENVDSLSKDPDLSAETKIFADERTEEGAVYSTLKNQKPSTDNLLNDGSWDLESFNWIDSSRVKEPRVDAQSGALGNDKPEVDLTVHVGEAPPEEPVKLERHRNNPRFVPTAERPAIKRPERARLRRLHKVLATLNIPQSQILEPETGHLSSDVRSLLADSPSAAEEDVVEFSPPTLDPNNPERRAAYNILKLVERARESLEKSPQPTINLKLPGQPSK